MDVFSLRSGNYSDATLWSTGAVPGVADTATIETGHTVVVNLANVTVAGVAINGELVFDPARTVTLQSSRNVLLYGKLTMRPNAANFVHTLRFINIDETVVAGGGMVPVVTDVGLWVMDGLLDLVGATKTAWTRVAGSVSAGATQIMLEAAPVGWRVGDTLSIVPTKTGTGSYDGFDQRAISAVNGATITLASPTTYAHPVVNGQWRAEVLNLTRNVRVEGTGNGASANTTNGRAHVFIHSHQPQTIRYVALRHMGPRRATADTYLSGGIRVPIYEAYLGRYSLHFHHGGDGSRGSLVEGVVAQQSGAHVFVPHASHGILFKNVVAYDSWDDAFWWDAPADLNDNSNNSDDITFDRCVVALVKVDPVFRGAGMSAFTLSMGENPVLRNCVAVGVQGNVTASGYKWPESGNHHPFNVWTFEDNLAHNNKVDGIYAWQNDLHPHLINGFIAYHNGQAGIEHGAYTNAYTYRNLVLYGNGSSIILHGTPQGTSRPDGYELAFEDLIADNPVLLTKHNASNINDTPILFKNCTLTPRIDAATGLPNPKVVVDEKFNGGTKAAWTDFVACNLEPSEIKIISAWSGSRIRVQRPDGTAYSVDYLGVVTTIAPFYVEP